MTASPLGAPEPEERTLLVPVENDFPIPAHRQGAQVIGDVVNWEATPNFDAVTLLLEAGTDVLPGQLLGVLHSNAPDVLTVVQVQSAFERNPNEIPELAVARRRLGLDRAYGPESRSTRIFRLAECTTVEELPLEAAPSLAASGPGRAPQTLARAGDMVVRLTPELVQASLGTLSNASEGLHLGRTAGPDGADLILKPDAFQYHIGIFGNPGRGKSYLAGALLEEAVDWDIPTLVIDVNGEFRETAAKLGGTVITLPDPKKFGIALHLLTPPELVAITPNVQTGTIYADLIELAHDQLRGDRRGGLQGHPRQITFDELRQRITELGDHTKAAKASVGAAIARVSQLERDPLIATTAFDFIAELERHRLLVLDCRYLTLRQTRLIAAMGARELQRIGRERAQAAERGDAEAAKWFALYAIDEAHTVIPDDEKAVSTQVLFELARMGRHVRTGLLLSSQSPADLNSSVLKKLQTRFVFALERDQLRAIPGITADLDTRVVDQLPKLGRGVCAVSGTSEIVRHGFLLSVRARRTPFGGSTPPVFGQRSKKTRNGDVDGR